MVGSQVIVGFKNENGVIIKKIIYSFNSSDQILLTFVHHMAESLELPISLSSPFTCNRKNLQAKGELSFFDTFGDSAIFWRKVSLIWLLE